MAIAIAAIQTRDLGGRRIGFLGRADAPEEI